MFDTKFDQLPHFFDNIIISFTNCSISNCFLLISHSSITKKTIRKQKGTYSINKLTS